MSKRADRDPVPPGYRVVYAKYITRNGKRIPPPKGLKAWRFVVKDK